MIFTEAIGWACLYGFALACSVALTVLGTFGLLHLFKGLTDV